MKSHSLYKKDGRNHCHKCKRHMTNSHTLKAHKPACPGKKEASSQVEGEVEEEEMETVEETEDAQLETTETL